jgi:UDP-N-acetylglucosamine 4,6-dehydratase/5-epimerase
VSLTGSILITGGSGTLGQAIVRAAATEHWDCTFTIYSRSELRQAQMRARYPHCRYILGDVRDYDRLAAAVAGHDLVIHAAAMKRVDDCELHPTECYQTNVAGSLNVIRACVQQQVTRCVGIGTDKQVRAETVYGASKLLMAGLFAAADYGVTTFTLARYGNVVASNGSVIPLWRKQAREGRPLTITDRRCTRFWMAESEAVATIVRATELGDGETVVPCMGALSLEDMARMIVDDPDLIEIGRRGTEKLHEDLIHEDEDAMLLEDEGVYIVGNGSTGHRYTSDTAPRLTREQFLAMLHEAEAHE